MRTGDLWQATSKIEPRCSATRVRPSISQSSAIFRRLPTPSGTISSVTDEIVGVQRVDAHGCQRDRIAAAEIDNMSRVRRSMQGVQERGEGGVVGAAEEAIQFDPVLALPEVADRLASRVVVEHERVMAGKA